ncbi:hypothetical protein Angca_004641 [Angiostrongylus cantonensis]|nr:hypothetical protein Angca_004641 [Angiostrongylus cantonensis]
MRLLVFFLLLRDQLRCAQATTGHNDFDYGDGISAEGLERNPIRLSSKHLDPENTLILRQGKPLMIECVYARDDIADISDLQWHKKGARPIDGGSSSSIFTTGLLEHGSRYRKKNLHFTAIHKRDEGFYQCRARNLGGIMFSREVRVIVLTFNAWNTNITTDEITWNDESHSVGALVGEPLTIDCGVKGNEEHHQITITDNEGESLDAEMYTIAGKEVTVERLTKWYAGKKINCVHIESYGKEELPIIDRREVHIDVWYRPEFYKSSIDQYAIVDEKIREVDLHCSVAASNPPVISFTFYRGPTELTDSTKYNLTTQKTRSKATLKIFNVDENDLGEYRCEVNNGKAKNSLIIHLKETSPPSEPRVTLYDVKENAITWKIEDRQEEGELPVKEIEIDYLRQSIVDEKLEGNEEDVHISDRFWNDYGVKQKRQKSRSGLYGISGLLKGAEYIFKFRHFSEAGEGPSVLLRARTNKDKLLVHDVKNSRQVSSSSALPFFVSVLMTRLILGNWFL